MEETGLLNKNFNPAMIFGYVMFIAYPLIFHDYFYDIVTCKFIVFIAITMIFMIFTLLVNSKKRSSSEIYTKMNNSKVRINNLDNINSDEICLEEKIVYILFGINIISFFLSNYKMESLIGADGRHNGIITITLYLVIYLCISGSIIDKEKMLITVAFGSICVGVLGILNFMDIDFLGFYDGLSMQYKQFYMSTLGHVNVYSSYFSITLPVVILLYFQSDKIVTRFLFFVLSVINVIGLICSGCESAAIILGTTFLCVLIRQREIDWPRWYILILTTIVFNRGLVDFNGRQSEKREISRLMGWLSDDKVIFIIILFSTLMIFLNYIIKWCNDKKINNSNFENEKVNKHRFSFKIFMLSIIIVGALFYLSMVIYYTFIDKDKNIGKWETFFRINKEFGSYRGYIWKIVIDEFKELSFLKKMFGIGPDVLYPFLYEKYGNDMYVVTNAYYDNAHNEFLQYLITTGIAGLLAYLMFFGVKIKTFIVNRKNNISIWDEIILCSCICYFVQSAVNINQVVTTPLYVIMLCVLNCREKGAEK